jgi:hypothetical protein
MASGALDVETIQVGGSTLRKQKKNSQNSREFPGIPEFLGIKLIITTMT